MGTVTCTAGCLAASPASTHYDDTSITPNRGHQQRLWAFKGKEGQNSLHLQSHSRAESEEDRLDYTSSPEKKNKNKTLHTMFKSYPMHLSLETAGQAGV